MAEKGFKWTRQQMRAIRERGRDVLVTASAGTGKTAVLSGRCVGIVSDAGACPDVWSVLVLTFTDAAAEEMRSRIAAQLKKTFLQESDPAIRDHLRRQLILLSGADISTIHSFCKRLITENFYYLGLDPAFGIIDSDEQRLLKAEVNEKVIEWAWQQDNLRQGLELLLRGRDLRATDGFLGHVIEISEFLDGVVSREDWFRRSLLLAEAVEPFNAELGTRQKGILQQKLQSILGQLGHVRGMCEDQDVDGKWLLKFDDDFIAPIAACLHLLETGNWQGCVEGILAFEKPRVYKPKGIREDVAEFAGDTIRDALARFVGLRELAILNPAYLDRVGGVGLQTKVLIELVRKFDQLYGKVKQSINCLDFADLEHYALKLLSRRGEKEGALAPSDVALALRRQYRYIFVDEYQDINPVQQAILGLISGEGNVFVVGDIKQSIYAFRGSEPHIFLESLKTASSDGDQGGRGVRVDLNANFRSNQGLLDFVNRLFGRIMTAEVADIDYDESARLRAAEAVSVPSREAGPVVEMHLLDDKVEEEESDGQGDESEEEGVPDVYTSRQRQAAMIAARIKEMVGVEPGRAEFQVYDKRTDSLRPVEYRDIVVLMRSPAKRANEYVEIFRMAGVPVSCQATSGYFEATEITDMLSLLKVLDNPQRDIELAAVLRSPLFGFSDSELAEVSVEAHETELAGFYERVPAYSEEGRDGELANKLRAAFAELDGWRTMARRGSLADLIWRVYGEKGYLAFVSALPNGRERKANLLKLHDRAIQFEGFATSAGVPSLGRFVEFIEKIIALGQDWTPAEAADTGENAVRIISVHRSKGLEFPVVVLAELNSRFNFRDIYEQCLVDRDGSLGLQVIDSEANARVASLAHQVVAAERLATTLAEEMRILYVATTRARERLILTASQKSKRCRERLLSGYFFEDGAVPGWQLRACGAPLDWILYGLSDQRALHEAFGTGLCPDGAEEELFSVHTYGQEELRQLNEYIHGLKCGKMEAAKSKAKNQNIPELLGRIRSAVTWEYDHKSVTAQKAKLSVSQMTHGDDEFAEMDYSRALERRPRCMVSGAAVYEVDGLSLGTATHLVISELDLKKPVCEASIREVIEGLVKKDVVSEPVAKAIDAGGILRFFETDTGRAVLDGRNRVRREWPFSLAMPGCECSPAPKPNASETVIVQGIVDMLVETAEGLIVVDFKTDRVGADEVAERAESYRTQLEVYGRAAEAVLKRKILSRILYFLSPGVEFAIL